MDVRLRMTPDGCGEEPQPTGDIEIWDSNLMEYRLVKPEEMVGALTQLVVSLYRWKAKVTGD